MPRTDDFAQVARRVVDQATGESADKRRNPAAVELGRLGGVAKARKQREAAENTKKTA